MNGFRDIWLKYKALIARHRLRPVRRLRSTGPNDIAAVIHAHNEALRLPDLLRHYRALGVDRFILIDDHSRDDTVALAANEPDIEIFAATGRYSAPEDGLTWAMAAIGLNGFDRWYLVIDPDELLVYHGCETHDLHRLASQMDRWRIPALPCLAVDMYGEDGILDTVYRRGERLVDRCPLFDADYGIDRATSHRFIVYHGGPLDRLAVAARTAFRPVLARTPFMRWSRNMVYRGRHELSPAICNLATLRGCLLRFRLMADLPDRAFGVVIREPNGPRWSEHRLLLDAIEADPKLSLAHEASLRFTSSHELATHGLMPSISWRG